MLVNGDSVIVLPRCTAPHGVRYGRTVLTLLRKRAESGTLTATFGARAI